MELEKKIPAEALSRAYLRQPLTQLQIDTFKHELSEVLRQVNANGTEDYHKNLVLLFVNQVYYNGRYAVNVHDRYDMTIRLGNKPTDKIGVLLEFKKPTEVQDMVTQQNPNVKSFHQLILYYLRETIDNENFEIKNLIVTNLYEWYIFDELWFEENIFRNKKLVKSYKEWKVAGHNTRHFYEQIVAPYLNTITENIPCTHFSFANLQAILAPTNTNNNTELVNLYKILSPQHLLKQPFANDANTLNKGFYEELLYIMGLEEKGQNHFIQRKSVKDRNEGSLIENTLEALRSRKFEELEGAKDSEQQYFEIALELCITWINRILFLKLLEAQLIAYHRNETNKYNFLNQDKIKDFDELNELFFDVLAIPIVERKFFVSEKFGDLPYLNSSLFEHTDLERKFFPINNLKNRLELPVFAQTVLTNQNGNRIAGNKVCLHYLFEFLNAYNFASDGTNNIQQDKNKLINAAVLGLIFEKINGYKEGAFFTPSYITMYMCRETLRRIVVQKFKEKYPTWNLKNFENLKKKIDYREEEERLDANEIINSIKVCDPAVGSGHFLVSALNELIAIKSELRILSHPNKTWIRGYKIEVVNDELEIIDKNDSARFCYVLNKINQPIDYLQELQETIFHEKQILIENCLFGVDINPKSVAICRLRLWIELLKNMYYTKESKFLELETLPNLDINIKTGNSLISRFSLGSNQNLLPKDKKLIKKLIDDYKIQVLAYKSVKDSVAKQAIRKQISNIKGELEKFIVPNDEEFRLLRQKEAEMGQSVMNFDMDWYEKQLKLTEEVKILRQKYTDKLHSLYKDALEWRFDFPEILDEEGNFVGFDAIVGNPPYIKLSRDAGRLADMFKNESYQTFDREGDIYCLFYEKATGLLAQNGLCCFITSKSWMRAGYGKNTRKFFAEKTNPLLIVDFGDIKVFDSASVGVNILLFQKQPKNLQEEQPLLGLRLGKNTWTGENNLAEYVEVNAYKLSFPLANEWIINKDVYFKMKEEAEKQGIKLSAPEWSIRINYGIKTGYNEAFIITDEVKTQLISEDAKNEEIIKPVLRGRDMAAWYPKYHDLYIIATFPSFQLEIDDYPALKKYLLSFGKERLAQDGKGRKETGNKWFETQDSIGYHEEFKNPKIIYRDITQHFDFAYMEDEIYMNNTIYMMTGDNLQYLCCVFNSKLFRYCFSDNFPELGGEGRRLFTANFQEIPIKLIDELNEIAFIRIVEYLVELKRQKDSTMFPYFEEIANALVYEYYFQDAFANENLAINSHVRVLPELQEGDKLSQIRTIYDNINQDENPIKQAILGMKAIPEVVIIEQNG